MHINTQINQKLTSLISQYVCAKKLDQYVRYWEWHNTFKPLCVIGLEWDDFVIMKIHEMEGNIYKIGSARTVIFLVKLLCRWDKTCSEDETSREKTLRWMSEVLQKLG